jgi:sugar phosphate isomerase/epimerase
MKKVIFDINQTNTLPITSFIEDQKERSNSACPVFIERTIKKIQKNNISILFSKFTFSHRRSKRNFINTEEKKLRMKISCLPLSLFPQLEKREISILDWAVMGKEIGLDGVDLSVIFLDNLNEKYLYELRNHFEDIDLPIFMITTYPDFTNPDLKERNRQVELEKKYIKVAGCLGASVVRITAGQSHPGIKEEDGIRWAIKGLKSCEQVAEENGVRLALENHGKPSCWKYTDFDQPKHIFLSLAKGIRNTSIGINFDTANPIVAGNDPLDVLEPVINQVISIHAADTDRKRVVHHVLLGTGLVPFDKIFSRLKRAGYNGWISIEEGSGLGLEGIRKAVRFIRETWQKTNQ